jgi:protocatechuate 3,4-dioxygenase beta subunit
MALAASIRFPAGKHGPGRETREEKNVKPDTISLRRRHLMIAGLAGAAAPFTVFAGKHAVAPDDVASLSGTNEGGGPMIVSGRILGASDAKPLAGAMVEVWSDYGCSNCTRATTDADGRFMLTASAPAEHEGAPRRLHYRVTHNGHATPLRPLYLGGGAGAAEEFIAHVERDDHNILRASFGVSVA